MAANQDIWVAPAEIELTMLRIAGLPVVDAVLARIGFDELLTLVEAWVGRLGVRGRRISPHCGRCWWRSNPGTREFR